jgi:hypothetical protein
MLEKEFMIQANRLSEVFPQHFSSQQKLDLIFERVKDFEISWLRKVVDRIILSNDPRFDFDDATRAERIARNNVLLTKDLISAQEELSTKISDQGLSNALKNFGANSLLEAIKLK